MKYIADALPAERRDQHTARGGAHNVHPVIRNLGRFDERPGNCQKIRVARNCEVGPVAYLRGPSIRPHDQARPDLSMVTILTKAHTGRSPCYDPFDNRAAPHLCSCLRSHAQ